VQDWVVAGDDIPPEQLEILLHVLVWLLLEEQVLQLPQDQSLAVQDTTGV